MSAGGTTLVSDGTTDVFLLKWDPSGIPVWHRRYAGRAGRQSARAVAIDGAGIPVIGGLFDYDVDFGQGALTATPPATDAFLAKLLP
jgi:hypothetical protein